MNINKIIKKTKKSKYIQYCLKLLFYIVGKIPSRKNTIIFESFFGKQYSDNPKAIYEYIKKEYPDYKLYWSIDRNYYSNFKHQNLNYAFRFSFKWIFLMATSRYWVVNCRLPLWIPKPRDTIYIQTWHGTPLKKLGIDIEEVRMPGTDTVTYKKNFLYESNKWDYLISANSYSTEIFKRSFGFDNTVLESGYPRNDFLYTHNNKQNIEEIKSKLNLPKGKKVILYAPTWRDNDYYGKGKYKFSLKLDLNTLKKELGDEYIVLLRMHYLVAENFELNEFKGFVYELSTYNDINELYLISDVLITDYSSVFFDYANLQRPILFFTYDIEEYREELRGFYFDLEKQAPGPLLENNEQIRKYLKRISEGSYQLPSSFKVFYNKYCYLEDGGATKRVVTNLLDQKDNHS
ncbi:CDP-glycerol glycerophosphotransferase family protein [Oceanobacillus jordanicus]|uniref:CDP-glycerol glycerophosphotransferase family protein n=1 Tax=Oceanobacillus jordanicus TaxID=2867266 RepID=A0AAW5B2X6_9BACI|nr:CDP-glycerol glycerophosphotransferase family protein [Oceanobacillus jordanicus]MCG3418020.1 CDP-glycerol glycerophosphotransferase family protein [Oceanobacillus jordanicus]